MLSLLWIRVLSGLSALWAKLAGYFVIAGVAIAAFFAFRAKYRKEGKEAIKAKIKEKNDEVQRKWDKVESSDPSFDRSLDGL